MNHYSRTKNTIKNSTASVIYKVVQIILQFLLRTIFIKYLGKEYSGISTLFYDILQMLSLVELGFGTAMLYAMYRPLAENDNGKIQALLKFYKKAYSAIGFIILGIGLAITPFIKFLVSDIPNVKESIYLIFSFYVITTASSYFLVYRGTLLRATQQSRIISWIDIIVFSIEAVVEVVLLIVFREFIAYLVTHLVFTVLRNVIISIYAERQFKEYFCDNDAELTKAEKESLFKDVFALALYKISGRIIYSTDSIVISAFISTQMVAVIGNFTLIIDALRSMIERVVDSVKPSIGNLAATESKEKQELIFNRFDFLAFCCACFCSTCLYVLLNPFVGTIWFDSSYVTSKLIIAILCMNFFIAVKVFPVESFRTANGIFIQGKFRPVIMAAMNIILDILLVKKWGIPGVLIATTVSRLSTQSWFDPYLIYKHVFKKNVWPYLLRYLLQIIITAFSCFIAQLLSEFVLIENTFMCFACKCFVSAIVPIILIFALYGKSPEFLEICTIVKQRLRKKSRLLDEKKRRM